MSKNPNKFGNPDHHNLDPRESIPATKETRAALVDLIELKTQDGYSEVSGRVGKSLGIPDNPLVAFNAYFVPTVAQNEDGPHEIATLQKNIMNPNGLWEVLRYHFILTPDKTIEAVREHFIHDENTLIRDQRALQFELTRTAGLKPIKERSQELISTVDSGGATRFKTLEHEISGISQYEAEELLHEIQSAQPFKVIPPNHSQDQEAA